MRLFFKRLVAAILILSLMILVSKISFEGIFSLIADNQISVYFQNIGSTKASHELLTTPSSQLKNFNVPAVSRINVDDYSGPVLMEAGRVPSEHSNELTPKIKLDAADPIDLAELFTKSDKCLNDSLQNIHEYLRLAFDQHFITDSKFSSWLSGQGDVTPVLEPDCNGDLDLVVFVTSSPGNFYRRAGIRLSWGRPDSEINKFLHNGRLEPYKVIFTVGRDSTYEVEKLVEMEAQTFRDILRLDYPDSYDNLTNKTIRSIEWFANNCKLKHLLKTDDDCFVNMAKLLQWLRHVSPRFKYVGKRNDGMPVIRDPLHRNYVPKDKHEDEVYRPYCAGGGYLLSGDVIKPISQKAKSIPQIVNEDAYLGMVAHALKIEPVDDSRFLPFIFSKRGILNRAICEWRDNFVMHGVVGRKQLITHWNAAAMKIFSSLCSLPLPPLS